MNLKALLQVRDSWHEPDEQDVKAKVTGKTFDNAGFPDKIDSVRPELNVVLYKGKEPVARINLATLFAYATGYRD